MSMNRRDFLQTASASAALASSSFARAAAPAVKPVRLGVIGAGSRGAGESSAVSACAGSGDCGDLRHLSATLRAG